MRLPAGLALVTGFVIAFAITGFPALASNAAIQADGFAWNPNTVSIDVGDTVTWSNPQQGNHNVHIDDEASPLLSPSTTAWSVSRTFTQAGTYTFHCDVHSFMTGTVTVGGGGGGTTTTTTTTTSPATTGTGTGTGTSTTPPPDTMPTGTITNPTQIEQNQVAEDMTKPAFIGTIERRASRRTLTLELRSSEEATLRASVFRRSPRGRTFSRVSDTSRHVKQGKNVVTLLRKRRSGAYRVKLQLVDAAGNRSATRTISFKLA